MTVQISLFDQAQPAEAICYGADSGKILQFYRAEKTEAPSKVVQIYGTPATPKRKINYVPNYRKGEMQTTYPIKDLKQLVAVAQWLYRNADPRYLLAYILGINLGLRANELLSLRYTDLFHTDGSLRYSADPHDVSDKIIVNQSKTGKKRGIFLNQACCHALSWYVTVSPQIKNYIYIFSSPRKSGRPITVDSLRKVLKRAALACDVKQNIGTHTLRKTWAWQVMLRNRSKIHGDISQLQYMLGHSDIRTTLRYLGYMDEEDKRIYHNTNLDLMALLLNDTPNAPEKLTRKRLAKDLGGSSNCLSNTFLNVSKHSGFGISDSHRKLEGSFF